MKAKTHLLQLLLVVTAASFAASATAAMYKWTDKAGNVQYTETPPPEGDSTEIAPPPRVAGQSSNSPSDQSNNNEEQESDKTAEVDAPLTPEQQDVYRRNCEAAKGNLETYKTARRVKQSDGEVVVMDDEKRQQKMQQAEEQIKKFCK